MYRKFKISKKIKGEKKMKNYIDLHMHSKYSDDGQFTPSELVHQCVEAGIKIMGYC